MSRWPSIQPSQAIASWAPTACKAIYYSLVILELPSTPLVQPGHCLKIWVTFVYPKVKASQFLYELKSPRFWYSLTSFCLSPNYKYQLRNNFLHVLDLLSHLYSVIYDDSWQSTFLLNIGVIIILIPEKQTRGCYYPILEFTDKTKSPGSLPFIVLTHFVHSSLYQTLLRSTNANRSSKASGF